MVRNVARADAFVHGCFLGSEVAWALDDNSGLRTQDHNHLGFMGARVFIASQAKLTGGLR
jgi:hypothetical protein